MGNKDFENVCIVIPAFNESKIIASLIEEIKQEGFNNIVVVDDGSLDDTSFVAKTTNCHVLRHIINRGKGAATQTGLDAAKLLGAQIVVTLDADGQHDPKEIIKLVEPLQKDEADVILGSRLLDKHNMPFLKQIVNHAGNLVTYFFYGLYVSDSQSGFRSYNKKALDSIKTKFDRYEFESEVISQIKLNNLRHKEVPIQVRYTDYSKTKYNNLKDFEAQKIFNSIRMFSRMVIRAITT